MQILNATYHYPLLILICTRWGGGGVEFRSMERQAGVLPIEPPLLKRENVYDKYMDKDRKTGIKHRR